MAKGFISRRIRRARRQPPPLPGAKSDITELSQTPAGGQTPQEYGQDFDTPQTLIPPEPTAYRGGPRSAHFDPMALPDPPQLPEIPTTSAPNPDAPRDVLAPRRAQDLELPAPSPPIWAGRNFDRASSSPPADPRKAPRESGRVPRPGYVQQTAEATQPPPVRTESHYPEPLPAPAAIPREFNQWANAGIARLDWKWVGIVMGLLLSMTAIAMQVAPPPGELIIRVIDPQGQPIERVNVYVRDELRCTQAPCELADLGSSGQLVLFETVGSANRAVRGVAVRGAPPIQAGATATPGLPTASPESTQAAASTAGQLVAPSAAGQLAAPSASGAGLNTEAPSDGSSDTGNQPTEARALASESKVVAKKPVARKAAPAKKSKTSGAKRKNPARSFGTLNIYAQPRASVIVNGRALGKTPLVGLRVKEGRHSVVLIHPTQGRRRVIAKVTRGVARNVRIRF